MNTLEYQVGPPLVDGFLRIGAIRSHSPLPPCPSSYILLPAHQEFTNFIDPCCRVKSLI
jgi:hypothetical protein